MGLENNIDSLVDSFHTKFFFHQHEVQDANKDTDSHHFCCHSRAHSQSHGNCVGCDPLVLPLKKGAKMKLYLGLIQKTVQKCNCNQ